jgi:hypothetical protein
MPPRCPVPAAPIRECTVYRPLDVGRMAGVSTVCRVVRAPWRAALSVAALLAAVVVTRLPGLGSRSVFNVDETTVATVSTTMRAGGRLYQDVIDRKPPLLPLLYGLVQWVTGSTDLRPVRIVGLVAVTATSLVLASEARRRYHLTTPPALLAVIPALMFAALPPEDAQAVGFELLGLLPASLAFVLAARGRIRAGGLLTGVAVLCKQTFALGLAPVLYLAWRQRGARGVAEVLAGTAAVVVLGGSFFGWQDFVHWTFLDASGYLSLDTGSLIEIGKLALGMGGLLALSLAGPIVLAGRRRGTDDVDVYLWLVSGIVGFAVGFRFLGHYALQAMPPAALLAMRGAVVPGIRRRLGVALTAAIAVMWVVLALVPDRLHDTRAYGDVAALVRSTTAPTDRVFVWGQSSEVYWASERLPASRYPHIQFLTDLSPGRLALAPDYSKADVEWTDLWADFAEHPPVLIIDSTVVDGGDVKSAVIGTSPLASYLTNHYSKPVVVDGMSIYRRVD